jgi:hypothetical protein
MADLLQWILKNNGRLQVKVEDHRMVTVKVAPVRDSSV